MVYQLESPDITTIIDYCEDLLKDEKIEVYDFGKIKERAFVCFNFPK